MRIAILCDSGGLAEWQSQAVDRIRGGNDLFLLQSGPVPPPQRKVRHFAYYLLNLFTIRNRMTRRAAFPDGSMRFAGSHQFQPRTDGAWAVLPDETIDWICDNRIDAVVKFGLGLLRIPDKERLPVPIISFHHGDPSRYRGRPAGFYELLDGAPFVGQVVQILSNRLDQGEVLAFAESRAIAHSYRKTLIDAYRLSPYLLAEALDALGSGRRAPVGSDGRNHRLPGTGTVIRFVAQRLAALARRLTYGAFIEKRWSVGWTQASGGGDPAVLIRDSEQGRDRWTVPDRLPGYSFYADPFFLAGSDDILVEAMRGSSGKGELLRLSGPRQTAVSGFSGHVSYPSNLEYSGRHYLVPEISDWSAPALYELTGDRAFKVVDLDVGGSRLLDPTLVRHGGHFYLFANRVDDGAGLLHLWVADRVEGPYRLHLKSPVRISARGSRMAGDLLAKGDALHRIGQDCRSGYGDGVLLFRIEELSPTDYREVPAGEVAFKSLRGPHTVNFRDGTLLFDWYEERFSLLAGVRRLSNRVYRIISG